VSSLELLLEQFQSGGATEAFIAIRHGKWDIPGRLKQGPPGGLNLAYLVADETRGVPFTLDVAHPFLEGAVVLVGFPDILLAPGDAFAPVVRRLEGGTADVVLGLFPPTDPDVNDQVSVDSDGRIRVIAPKPVETPLDYAWAIAAWRPAFTRFMRARTSEMTRAGRTLGADGREYSLGHLLADALEAGLRLEGALIDDGSFLDIGTPAGLERARAQGRIDPDPHPSTTAER
jgi:glucose-1-phosphate thymidylyltransferase